MGEQIAPPGAPGDVAVRAVERFLEVCSGGAGSRG